MSKFNFKSAICTSREQSEKLLALGLKKETSDMYWVEKWGLKDGEDEPYFTGEYIVCIKQTNMLIDFQSTIPAWSLHRLIEMIGEPYNVSDWLGHDIHGHYNDAINFIEWLIKEKYFNKGYLV